MTEIRLQWSLRLGTSHILLPTLLQYMYVCKKYSYVVDLLLELGSGQFHSL